MSTPSTASVMPTFSAVNRGRQSSSQAVRAAKNQGEHQGQPRREPERDQPRGQKNSRARRQQGRGDEMRPVLCGCGCWRARSAPSARCAQASWPPARAKPPAPACQRAKSRRQKRERHRARHFRRAFARPVAAIAPRENRPGQRRRQQRPPAANRAEPRGQHQTGQARQARELRRKPTRAVDGNQICAAMASFNGRRRKNPDTAASASAAPAAEGATSRPNATGSSASDQLPCSLGNVSWVAARHENFSTVSVMV